MYIISKKKDYYDGVAGSTGIDKTIVYQRDIIELDDKERPNVFRKKTNYTISRKESPFFKLGNSHLHKSLYKKYPHNAYFIIGFCGKLYIGWKLYSFKKRENFGDSNVNTEIIFDVDYMKEIFEPESWTGNFSDNVNYVLTYDPMDLFRTLNSPCFVYDSDYHRKYLSDRKWDNPNDPKFIVNPLLKEYEFYKVFDAFQAFQEIQMFLGGVLGNKEKPIIEVADKYKIGQHGFDKWSFRKEPERT